MTRRGRGAGSVYQDGDRWRASISVRMPNGGRRRRTRVRATQAEAERALRDLHAELDRGVVDDESVAAFLERWLEENARLKIRARTYDAYESIIRNHLIPELGKKQLAKLSVVDVQRLLNMRRAFLAPRTLIHIKTLLGTALHQAEREGLVTRNVARLAETPRAPDDEVEPLSVDQARQLLTLLEGDRLEALYKVALAIGMRQGEILGLLWADVELEEGMLHVRRQLQRRAGGWRLVPPKTAKGKRTIALPDTAIAALRSHRTRQLEERMRAGPLWTEHGLVFTRGDGEPLNGQAVTRRLQAVMERGGLPRKRFHDLRHSCASLLLAQGVPMKLIQVTLGHTSMKTTADIYAHVAPGLREQVAAAMDGALAR